MLRIDRKYEWNYVKRRIPRTCSYIINKFVFLGECQNILKVGWANHFHKRIEI